MAWSVIQHSNIKTIEKYLPIIKKATENNQLFSHAYPFMLDRLCVLKNIPQLYGTQQIFNKEKQVMEVYKMDDIKEVNMRRKKYKLPEL